VEEDIQDLASWRALRDRCNHEGLEIVRLFYGDEEVYPKAEGYFAFFDQTGYLKGNTPQIIMRAIGCITHEGTKARTFWYKHGTNERSMVEVRYLKDWESTEIATEMTIKKCSSTS